MMVVLMMMTMQMKAMTMVIHYGYDDAYPGAPFTTISMNYVVRSPWL